MEKMLRTEKEREVNRKLSAIMKGPRQSLDWIEVPTGVWYYSHTKKSYTGTIKEYLKPTPRGLPPET